MTEHFLPTTTRRPKKARKALRAHVIQTLEDDAPWLPRAGRRLVGIGGTMRNLAAAAQAEEGLPSIGVQGFEITRERLDALIDELAELPAAERASIKGIKYARADLILAGAIVVQSVLEAGGFDAIEVTEAGLREGVFFGSHLDGDPPLFDDVRRSSVLNLAARYQVDPAHTEHVCKLALGLFDELAGAGLHPGDRWERELLWCACVLHDIGMSVDYDDHHKHSRYLILNAGLPGFAPREVALIAQAARYHRKGMPDFAELEPLTDDGDEARLDRMSILLRLAEDLERSRDQSVHEAHVHSDDGTIRLALRGGRDRGRRALGGTARGRAVRARIRQATEGGIGMSLTLGTGPLGGRPAASNYTFESPPHQILFEPDARRLRALRRRRRRARHDARRTCCTRPASCRSPTSRWRTSTSSCSSARRPRRTARSRATRRTGRCASATTCARTRSGPTSSRSSRRRGCAGSPRSPRAARTAGWSRTSRSPATCATPTTASTCTRARARCG